jgi:hypothetical protein
LLGYTMGSGTQGDNNYTLKAVVCSLRSPNCMKFRLAGVSIRTYSTWFFHLGTALFFPPKHKVS